MSDERDYRTELETGFTQLFGEAFRGLNLDCVRDTDWYSTQAGLPNHVVINERYILTIHVMYDIDASARLVSNNFINSPIYSLKQFVIGSYKPAKVEHNHCHKVDEYGDSFVVRAEYVTNKLSEFLETLNEEAQKAYDARFYEAMDKAIKIEES